MHRSGSKIVHSDTRLVDRLMDPDVFDHPVTSVERLETHISWVILTDDFAYKIKKPVVLDFLDFRELERRRFYCDEEVRLNRPCAPYIYLGVVAITEQDGRLRVGGTGKPIEYAVKMRRFDQDWRLDRQLVLGKLTVQDMHELGQAVAARHDAAPRIPSDLREHVLQVTAAEMHNNFSVLDGHFDAAMLEALRHWTETHLELLQPLLAQRFDNGFVRDCHGDLHLANIVRLPDGISTFDCIEFNEDLRRTDTYGDVAFLVMDLVTKGRVDLAAHFLNRYLERSGDYGGIALLDLYFVYRCLVRAKVAVIMSEESELESQRLQSIAEADRYCRIALRQTRKADPCLIIMSGISGSGKTWVSRQLMAALPAIRVRSDVERKRMFGFDEQEDSHSAYAEGMYSTDANVRVYKTLRETALTLLQARHTVIIDAAFLQAAERSKAMQMAQSCGFHAMIVQIRAPEAVMRKRIETRRKMSNDASESGIAVFERQMSKAQPLSDDERERSIVFENVDGADMVGLIEKVRQHSRQSETALLPGSLRHEAV